MNRTTDLPKSGSITRLAQLTLLAAILAAPAISVVAAAQAPAAAAPASRLIGAVTAINGTTLTIKTDAGQSSQVDVPSAAVIKRIAPGQKDLSTADNLQFSDLAIGDRVLIKLDPSVTSGNSQALQIIAVKQADVQEKQRKDREDWQRNGLGGLVKSVDAGSGVIVLTTGTGANSKTITVNTSASTMLKRYAPASVSFDAAQPAAIGVIHAGDQLRARGTKSADGTSIAAVEVVSGTFRNISGTVESTDPAGSSLVVKDLTTKKLVTIHITPEVQMRKLSDRMAGFLAARLKSGAAGAATHAGAAGAGGTSGAGQSGGAQGGGGLSGDPQQLLNRAPVIQIADLKKGDAVMLVATDGTTDVTAITLVAGVEALLQAPAETQNLLNNWSMGSGSGAAEAAQ